MTRRRPKIIVVGSANTDMIVRVTRIPRPGETVLGGEFMTAAGGKGANQAVAAARLGGRVSFIGRVGCDSFGKSAIATLKRDGIDTRAVTHDAARPSGVALIFVADHGENSIAVASGANAALSARDIRTARSSFHGARVMLVQLETPLDTVRAAIDEAHRAGVRVILNPAPAQALPAAVLKKISVLTPNETEAELLTGIPVDNLRSATMAARKLRRRSVETVIITLGKRGALIATDDGEVLVKGFPVKPIDTTAAGDVFNGALAVALAEDCALLEAVRFANAAAAISVTRRGAQPSAPRRAEVNQLLT
jgi:ribokinase